MDRLFGSRQKGSGEQGAAECRASAAWKDMAMSRVGNFQRQFSAPHSLRASRTALCRAAQRCVVERLEGRSLLSGPGITLDPTFGAAGSVSTDFNHDTDFAYALSPLPGGKVLLAGQSWNGSGYDFALARFNADGSLDSSFGNGGRVLTNVGSNADAAFAMAVAPDGKIV